MTDERDALIAQLDALAIELLESGDPWKQEKGKFIKQVMRPFGDWWDEPGGDLEMKFQVFEEGFELIVNMIAPSAVAMRKAAKEG